MNYASIQGARRIFLLFFALLWRICKASTCIRDKQLGSRDSAGNSTFAGDWLDREDWRNSVQSNFYTLF